MNKVILMGRLTRDPEIRYSQAAEPVAVARYTLAVDRRFAKRSNSGNNEQTVDFINCVAFGKTAEFAEKYFRQGQRVLITGRIQTGNYTNKDGQRVYTTDVVIEDQEFADTKGVATNNNSGSTLVSDAGDGFMNIPEGIDEELPFT